MTFDKKVKCQTSLNRGAGTAGGRHHASSTAEQYFLDADDVHILVLFSLMML
jgi:hypothetical protein